jgi:hypothetical protein
LKKDGQIDINILVESVILSGILLRPAICVFINLSHVRLGLAFSILEVGAVLHMETCSASTPC